MSAHLTKLLRQTHISSADELLAAANAALKTKKGDQTAQHTRIVALLNLDRFDDVIRIFEGAGDGLKQRARLEYAYALYKTGELQKAEEEAKRGPSDHRGLKHILALTAYRLEKFEEVAELYEQLSQPSPAAEAEASDVRINSIATDAQLEWKGLGHLIPQEKKKPKREDLDAFESCYNAACVSIARGELGQGEVLLRRAIDLCYALDDLSDEAKKAEILPIVVQRVYVLSRLGRDEEARQLFDSVDTQELSDLATRQIADVNSMAIAGTPPNPYLAHRQFHSAEIPSKKDLPFEYQSSILRHDEYVVDLLTYKHTGVAKSTLAALTSAQLPTTSSSVNSLSVLNAAAHARSATGKEGLKAILPLLEKRPNDVGLLLTIVQLYILTNNHGSAIALLEKFLAHLENSSSPADADVRYAPGLIGTLVSLYALQGRKTHIRTELVKAAKYWRSKMKDGTDPTPHASLLKAAGTALLESTDSADMSTASDLFSALYAQDPNDKATNAGLVASLALTAPERITTSQLDRLPPAARLVAGIDAAALEEAGVARSERQAATVPTKKRHAANANASGDAEKKPKKIKASRMPKDYDPDRKLDPERWLPMRDRSYYRPKGKKGKARMAGMTQGGVVAEDEKGPRSEVQQAKQGPAAGASGQNKAKKKKVKGGKW